MIALLGWACAAFVLFAYLASAATGRPGIFDWANVILCGPTAWANAEAGAAFAAALSLAFGAIGLVGLIRRVHARRSIKAMNARVRRSASL